MWFWPLLKEVQVQQDFVAPGRQDLDVPIWAVKEGELFKRAFIMLVMGYCWASCFEKQTFIQNFDPF